MGGQSGGQVFFVGVGVILYMRKVFGAVVLVLALLVALPLWGGAGRRDR